MTGFDLEKDFEWRFTEALLDLRMDSSVGNCDMRFYGSTIGEALGYEFVGCKANFDPTRLQILKQLVWSRLHNPEQADNIKVFIKQEAHKEQKLVDGRYRLISAVSLVDTMADRIMFKPLTSQVMRSTCHTPIMIGWSPMAGGYRYLAEVFKGAPVRGLDKTAWDWSCGEWILRRSLQVLHELTLNAPDAWFDWTAKRWVALFRDAKFQFSDGTIVQQPGWGIMKSGCYLTIVLNSIGQCIHHALAMQFINANPKFVVMGDDVTLEDFVDFPLYERIVKDNGAYLKPSVPETFVGFAGWMVEGAEVYPEYWRKHVYNILNTDAELLPQVIDAYLILYAFDANFTDWIRETFSGRYARAMRSRYSCKKIMQGE